MSIALKLRSRLVSLLLSPRARALRRGIAEQRRRMSGRPHVLKVFLELDDPYSYLLSLYLRDVVRCYDVTLEIYLVEALVEGFRPRPDVLAVYAQQDCERVASELGVPFLDTGKAPPVEHRRALIDSLAASEGKPNHPLEVIEALSLYWRGDIGGVARRADVAKAADHGRAMLERNQRLLVQLGHYNSAMIYYGGEWYWGVDRLHYLMDRLDALGARREGAGAAQLGSIRQAMQVSLPVTPPGAASELPPLEFFYSFRSPYSYLSLGRVFAIADAFGLELKIRPVLPMVIRGLPMPKQKIIYIVTDTTREAERHAISFGKFADPLGEGVERCLAVYEYAQSEKRGREFLVNAGEAIWADAVDVATDSGMRKVTGRTGLFWPDVLAAMESDSWRENVEANREVMEDSGSWGVPTLRLGDFVVWGQDRDWLLVRHIEERCDTGEGILV